ncbi:hypothetical protein ACFQ2B_31320 [Streptomyces stramineus]
MDWIVETAAVSESPLYLQIARQLREYHLLEHLTGTKGWAELDTRSADRAGLRWRLLDTWREALVAGRIHDEIALAREQREVVVEVLSALAGIGLLRDRLEVRLDELTGPDGAGAAEPVTGVRDRLWEKLCGLGAAETDDRRRRALLSLCATQGEQLGLVESRGERVRFPHSIVQAYLGARYLDVAGYEPLTRALEEPGRELLIALVLNSRAALGSRPDADAKAARSPSSASSWTRRARARTPKRSTCTRPPSRSTAPPERPSTNASPGRSTSAGKRSGAVTAGPWKGPRRGSSAGSAKPCGPSTRPSAAPATRRAAGPRPTSGSSRSPRSSRPTRSGWPSPRRSGRAGTAPSMCCA